MIILLQLGFQTIFYLLYDNFSRLNFHIDFILNKPGKYTSTGKFNLIH